MLHRAAVAISCKVLFLGDYNTRDRATKSLLLAQVEYDLAKRGLEAAKAHKDELVAASKEARARHTEYSSQNYAGLYETVRRYVVATWPDYDPCRITFNFFMEYQRQILLELRDSE